MYSLDHLLTPFIDNVLMHIYNCNHSCRRQKALLDVTIIPWTFTNSNHILRSAACLIQPFHVRQMRTRHFNSNFDLHCSHTHRILWFYLILQAWWKAMTCRQFSYSFKGVWIMIRRWRTLGRNGVAVRELCPIGRLALPWLCVLMLPGAPVSAYHEHGASFDRQEAQSWDDDDDAPSWKCFMGVPTAVLSSNCLWRRVLRGFCLFEQYPFRRHFVLLTISNRIPSICNARLKVGRSTWLLEFRFPFQIDSKIVRIQNLELASWNSKRYNAICRHTIIEVVYEISWYHVKTRTNQIPPLKNN